MCFRNAALLAQNLVCFDLDSTLCARQDASSEKISSGNYEICGFKDVNVAGGGGGGEQISLGALFRGGGGGQISGRGQIS